MRPLRDRRIADPDLAGDPADQGSAAHDQNRIADEHVQDQRAAIDDQRDAHGEPQADQQKIAVGGGRYRDDVVETHHRIGDDDRPDRAPDAALAAPAFAVSVAAVLGYDHLDP